MEISIEYRDSLSDQNQDKDKYSLVLANPPFKGSLDAESVSGDLLKVCKTKKTELLFLTLFLRILKIGGRCACIVPDGVLFGSSKAHKDIRTEIVENQRNISFDIKSLKCSTILSLMLLAPRLPPRTNNVFLFGSKLKY